MSSPFDLNRFFKAPIIKIDNRVRPPNLIQREVDEGQKEINAIIDRLGSASAKAQHLHAPVTSSSKLASSDHFMYLIKDSEGNGGYGLAIGFLKIGFKKLYVYDLKGELHEREPLCVLDFYISEPYQRQSYGKKLYDYMLMNEKVEPADLAIDRPSLKFSSFLKKHYDLSHSIPQTNNFVIFEGFFSKQSEDTKDRREPTLESRLQFSYYKKCYDANRISKSAGVCRRAVERLNSKPQTANISPNMVKILNSKSSASEEEDCSNLTLPVAAAVGPVRPSDTTRQVSGSYLPSIKECRFNDQCQIPKQTKIPDNHIIDPCNHQLFTTTKRVVSSRCGLSTPLAGIYSRHMAANGWPQPNEDYMKRGSNNQVLKAPVIPSSPIQNADTFNNGINEMKTTKKFYVNKFCSGGGGGGGGDDDGERGGKRITMTSTKPSSIRLPAVDNIYYQPLQPKTTVKSPHQEWTLFTNNLTYTKLLHRGYSHTRLW